MKKFYLLIVTMVCLTSCVEQDLWRDNHLVEEHILRDYGKYFTPQELPIRDCLQLNDTLFCVYTIQNIIACRIVDLKGCDLGEGFPEVKRPPYPVGYILVNVTYNIYDDCKFVVSDGVVIDSGTLGLKTPINTIVFDFAYNEIIQVDFDWGWVQWQMWDFLHKYTND